MSNLDRFCMECGDFRMEEEAYVAAADASGMAASAPAVAPVRSAPSAQTTRLRSVDLRTEGAADVAAEAEAISDDGYPEPAKKTKKWLVVAASVLGLFVVVASTVAVLQMQRADRAESSLAIANKRVADQEKRIAGLNGEVSDLNSEIDDVSSDLSKAQDNAAVNGMRADMFQEASYELAQASDSMHAAVENIDLMMRAFADGDYYQAEAYAQRVGANIAAARQHEANALAAIGG